MDVPMMHPFVNREISGKDRFTASMVVYTAFTMPVSIAHGINNTPYGDELFAALFEKDDVCTVSVDDVYCAIRRVLQNLDADCNQK